MKPYLYLPSKGLGLSPDLEFTAPDHLTYWLQYPSDFFIREMIDRIKSESYGIVSWVNIIQKTPGAASTEVYYGGETISDICTRIYEKWEQLVRIYETSLRYAEVRYMESSVVEFSMMSGPEFSLRRWIENSMASLAGSVQALSKDIFQETHQDVVERIIRVIGNLRRCLNEVRAYIIADCPEPDGHHRSPNADDLSPSELIDLLDVLDPKVIILEL